MKKIRLKLYNLYVKILTRWGFKRGYIRPYSEELIEKLRGIYYGGVPASVLLLCMRLTNGKCYDRALLLSRAFLDDDDGDVSLVYAAVEDLKLHGDNPDHCFVERVTKNGEHLIYDTSMGLVYTKKIYWLLNLPKVRKVNDKQSIIDFLSDDIFERVTENSVKEMPLIAPVVEGSYGKEGESYSMPGFEILQREFNLFKEKVRHETLSYA